VFDDDTIPGNRWFENCINTMNSVGTGVLGTCGMIFKPGDVYDHIKRVGWVDPNSETVEVDAVCHSWFFKRDTFVTYINDLPNTEQFKIFGEDMHLSHTHQKMKKIKTYVPPHPKDKKELWGSDYDKGWAYGTESCAISVSMPFKNFTIPFKRIISLGYETVANKDLFIKNYDKSLDFFIKKMQSLDPFALIRFSDKEYFVLENNPIKTVDNWNFNKNSVLRDQLKKVLTMNSSNVFFGIQHKCDNSHFFNYYKKILGHNNNLTFSTIFCNANYIRFLEFLSSFSQNVILIANKKPNSNMLGQMNIIDFLEIETNMTDKWDSQHSDYIEKAKMLSKKYFKKIFFFSGGPIAKILIYHMYNENPNNIYVDVGSSIDYLTKNCVTREFHKMDSAYNSHKCTF
jgi:hypothetical protein